MDLLLVIFWPVFLAISLGFMVASLSLMLVNLKECLATEWTRKPCLVGFIIWAVLFTIAFALTIFVFFRFWYVIDELIKSIHNQGKSRSKPISGSSSNSALIIYLSTLF